MSDGRGVKGEFDGSLPEFRRGMAPNDFLPGTYVMDPLGHEDLFASFPIEVVLVS